MSGIALFSGVGLDFIFRWLHLLAGVTWIGLLYYFNFVQGEYFKEAEDAHRKGAVQKLVPRALWWFRWGAMLTLLTGLLLLLYRMGHATVPAGLGGMEALCYQLTAISYDIFVGSTLGIIMFLNVWLVIWPNQKLVIAGAKEAAQAAPKAALASRTNTLFSAPMLFFMGSSTHLPTGLLMNASGLGVSLILLVILLLEANALFGKQGPMASVRGVITCSVLLTALLYGLLVLV